MVTWCGWEARVRPVDPPGSLAGGSPVGLGSVPALVGLSPCGRLFGSTTRFVLAEGTETA